MMRKIAMMLLLMVLALGLGDGTDRGRLRYNQVRQKASHNSYQRKQGIVTQLKEFRIRTIEFDLHSEPNAPPGDWLVYHNINGDAANCHLASECFSQVWAFHQAEPAHEVVTIFFDLEGIRAPGRGKKSLNQMFLNFFPGNSILRPADLLAACPGAKGLQESVTKPGCGWPRLVEARGKFILVITGGLNVFKALDYDPKTDLYFLASTAESEKDLKKVPDQIFFNLAGPDPFAKTATEAGFVSRCYWLNSREQYEAAIKLGANLLATDDLDPERYPWTNTSADDGWPFQEIK